MNIWDGCKQGKFDMVKAMLEDNASWANAKDDRDVTPLSYAVVGGHRHMVELLLQFKANPNLETTKSLPLTLACMTKDDGIVRLLLQNNAHVRQPNKQGLLPIHAAASSGSVGIMKVFADFDRRLLSLTTFDPQEKTALFLAIEEGQVEAAKYLHSEGVSLKELPKDGTRPIHAAIKHNKKKTALEMVKWLVSVGEDPNQFGPFNDEQMSPLHLACALGRFRISEYLVKECKVNVEAETADLWTPMQYCAQSGHEKICRLLVDAGASLRHQTDKNCVPLISSAAAGKANLTQKDKSVIEHRSVEDKTPLHYAVASGDLPTVEALIQAGADVNATSETDISPLHAAVRSGNLQIIDLLVKHDATLRITDSNGVTPLHAAALSDHPAAFVLLARLGADVTAKTANGHIPIELFEREEMREAVQKELEQHGGKQVNVDALRKCSSAECRNYEMHEGQFQRCSRCKSAKYCSTACQKADWATHKKTCRPAT